MTIKNFLCVINLLVMLPAMSFGQQPFRVVSYNIKHCRGNDGKVDLARTAGVIEELSADFVGLQEVDENAKRSGAVDQVAELGKRLNMFSAFGSFMDFQGGRYGLGILSKHPIRNITSVRLPKRQ